jgi:hypothetical protein
MASFLDLQNQTLEACGHTTAASSVQRTRVKRAINNWHRTILSTPGHNVLLRDSEATFETVASQHTYGLGLPVGRLLGVSCDAYETVLALKDRAWLRREDPGLTGSSTPASAYIPRGWFPVQQHPASALDVWAKSTNAADTTQVVDWEFVLEGPIRISGNTTLNGTTAVQLGTATTVIEIGKLSLRTAAAGVVTIHENTGTGTTLATYQIGQLNNQFFHIQLWPTPSAADVVYRIDYSRVLQDLVQDTDIPLLPYDFHHLLALGAEYEEWRKLSDDRMVTVHQDLQARLRSLNAYVWDLQDDTQGAAVQRSRLGGWFAAGT